MNTPAQPRSTSRNISIFYFTTVLNNCWFIAGNWIFFWTKYMTFGTLGVVDAVAFAFGLLMEIPTGAISDLIGKRHTMVVSGIFGCLGSLVIAMSSGPYQILVGFLLVQVGWAFYSGAAEAMVYDSLVEGKQEERFDQVISKSNTLSIIAGVASTLLGALLYNIDIRLPHVGWGLAYLGSFIVSLFLVEPKIDSERFSVSTYLLQMRDGVKQLLNPSLKSYLPVMFTILGFYYLFNYGFIRPAMLLYFNFNADLQSMALAALGIGSAFIVSLIPWMRKRLSDSSGLFVISLFMGISFVLGALPLGVAGFIVVMFITFTGDLATPWISVIVNKELPSKYRATALSSIALVTKVPYVLVAVLAGGLIENGFLWVFSLGVGILLLLITGLSYISTQFSARR